MAEEIKSKEEEKVTSGNTIGYQGSVKISIQKGNKIISTTKRHNNGTTKLFRFLCNCLAQAYSSIAYTNERPCRLVLFDDTLALNKWSADTALNAPVFYNAPPTPGTEDTSITFHFMIPYALLRGTANGVTITHMALYNDNFTGSANYETERYAYIELGKDGIIHIADTSVGNFAVIVDWTMKIKDASDTGGSN